MLDDLKDYEQRVYSQSGEDGVLRRLFDVIGVKNQFFVEFGAADGLALSNTAHLRLDHGWSGLLMEGSEKADGELVQREFVSAENINQLFRKYEVPPLFDFLSIDIDGNDYWVWKALEGFVPRVVVVEYNIFFGVDQAFTVPYEAERTWDRSTYHGASLAAFNALGKEKGYTLVHSESYAPNAFFVLNSELPAGYSPLPLSELAPWDAFFEPLSTSDRDWVDVSAPT
ncbi:MAG: hypothetical protein CL917_18965 [Deltaproteobacteria bacterium]|nr:hypothetical protein [Deltaproteobacteria bacterium]